MFEYKNKIIVVTGAARGIGKAVSIKFSEAGAIVVLADVHLAPQEETVTELRRRGLSAYAFQCDVTSDESVNNLKFSVLQTAGVPDIVYNNAAIVRTGGVLNANTEYIRQELEVNVIGYLRMARAFLPDMINRDSGWIVNTASPNAFIPPPMVADNLLGYCITKGAEVSLSQCMAISLRPKGIRVSVVFPDITYTDSVHELQGSASADFHRNFSDFISSHSRSAEVVAERIVDELKKGEYFVNLFDGFEEYLVTWAQHRMDPPVKVSMANM